MSNLSFRLSLDYQWLTNCSIRRRCDPLKYLSGLSFSKIMVDRLLQSQFLILSPRQLILFKSFNLCFDFLSLVHDTSSHLCLEWLIRYCEIITQTSTTSCMGNIIFASTLSRPIRILYVLMRSSLHPSTPIYGPSLLNFSYLKHVLLGRETGPVYNIPHIASHQDSI